MSYPPRQPAFRHGAASTRVPLVEHHRGWWSAVVSGQLGPYFVNGPNFAIRIHRPIAPRWLSQSLALLLERHRILSARIIDGESGPEYVFDETRVIPLECMDVSSFSGETRVKEARRLASEQVWKPFERTGPWVRAFLIKLGDADHVFGLVMHHLLSDAVSVGIARAELMQAYRSYATGQRPPARQEEPLQYAEWILARNEWLRGGAAEPHARYWRALLRGAPATRLRPDRELDLDEYSDVALHSFRVPAEVVDGLRRLGERKRRLFQASVAAALIATLAGITGAADVVVASQITGRQDAKVMGTIGALFDAFAIRAPVSPSQSFDELWELVHWQLVDSLSHQVYPFELVKASFAEIGASDAFPMFNLLDLADQPGEGPQNTAAAQDFELLPHPVERQTRRIHTSFYLRLLVRSDGISAQIVYLASMYRAHTIAAFAEAFSRVLEGAALDSGRPLSSLFGERRNTIGQ